MGDMIRKKTEELREKEKVELNERRERIDCKNEGEAGEMYRKPGTNGEEGEGN